MVLWEMSLLTLIDLFIRNNQHEVHNQYNELKRQELTWEQFLTEVTVINNEEARWDTSKRIDKNEGKRCPNLENKQALSSKKNPKVGLSDCAEEFQQGLNIFKEKYQKRVRDNFCLRCGKKGHFVGDCKGNSSSGLGKGRQC